VTLLLTLFLAVSSPNPEWIGKAPASANRIVSLAPNLTELVFELGEGSRIVGVTRFDNYPPAVLKLPKVGGFINPNLEAIVAAKPDVVLATPNSGGKTQAETLARLGIPVLSIPAQQWTHLSPAIKTLATLLKCPQRGQALVADLKAQETTLAKRFSHLPVKRAMIAIGLKPLVSAGPKSFIDRFLPLIGLRNVVTKGGPYPILNTEAVISLKPELVLDLSMATDRVSETYWKNFPQKDGFRIQQSRNDALLRLGPRLFKALQELGDLIHAEKAP